MHEIEEEIPRQSWMDGTIPFFILLVPDGFPAIGDVGRRRPWWGCVV